MEGFGRDRKQVVGVVVRGHRVASGAGGDARFPQGTIAPQLPYLQAAVPELDLVLGSTVHPATINLRLPGSLRLRAPEHRVAAVPWTDMFPPETFFLSRAELTVASAVHPAFLYMPDPTAKPDHHQAPDVVELLAAFIPGLRYGMQATLSYSERAIAVE